MNKTIEHFGVTLNYVRSFNDDRKAVRFISALVNQGKTAKSLPDSNPGSFTVHIYSS